MAMGRSFLLVLGWQVCQLITLIVGFIGQHGAHLGLIGPRCAPCWPHALCYLGTSSTSMANWQFGTMLVRGAPQKIIADKNGHSLMAESTAVRSPVLWLTGCEFCIVCGSDAKPSTRRDQLASKTQVHIEKKGKKNKVVRRYFQWKFFLFRSVVGSVFSKSARCP